MVMGRTLMSVARVKAVPKAPMEMAKQMAPDAISAGASAGRVTSRMTAHDPAPSECAASARDLSMDCAVAMTESTIFRSEEHTSELQSLMRISYAVFCLTKQNYKTSMLTTLSSQSQ